MKFALFDMDTRTVHGMIGAPPDTPLDSFVLKPGEGVRLVDDGVQFGDVLPEDEE